MVLRAVSALVGGGAVMSLSDYPSASLTGVTVEANVFAVRIPGNTLGPKGQIRIMSFWTFPNSSNGKPITHRLANTSGAVTGGMAAATAPFTGMTTAQLYLVIRNTGVTNIQNMYPNAGPAPYGAATAGGIGGGVDTTVDCFVNFNATLALATETITLLGYSVECFHG